ncbi:hypothetical protein GCM10012275_20240 [Longimycelium tulufanense]|uniref:EamA domain-containing protein n=1 Tax=Longimycelium tulufanense TaxID=907463 RepID=A0A8J3FTG0_9PSEU|nr:EamA family transporter [Longimycelium tulufanense]GGM49334.1 hypothetical protein GCM10012275_20240 [Longimycelium tulufanense]
MSTVGLLIRTGMGPALMGTAFLVAATTLPPTPLWNAVYRVAPAGVLLWALRPRMPHGSWWWRSLVLGGLNFSAFYSLQFVAVHRIPGGMVGSLSAAQALLVPFLALALLREQVRALQFVVAAGGVSGVALLVLRGVEAMDAVGVLAGAGTAVAAATGFVLTRRWGVPSGVGPTTALAWQMLAGAALLGPLALAVEGGPPALDAWGGVGVVWLSAAATALAFTLLFGGLHAGTSAVAMSLLTLLNPLVATGLGWLVVGESLTPVQLLGVGLLCAAVVGGQLLVNTGPTRTARTRARPKETPAAAAGDRPRQPIPLRNRVNPSWPVHTTPSGDLRPAREHTGSTRVVARAASHLGVAVSAHHGGESSLHGRGKRACRLDHGTLRTLVARPGRGWVCRARARVRKPEAAARDIEPRIRRQGGLWAACPRPASPEAG